MSTTAALKDPSMAPYAHYTSKERRKIAALQRRAAWLRERVEASTEDLTFDKQELGALEWALGKLATMA